MIEKHLVFRFTYDSTEYNISTSSFLFTESSDAKIAYGDINDANELSINKEMGCFVWGTQSSHEISELWIINSLSHPASSSGKYDDLLNMPRDTEVSVYVAEVPRLTDSDFDDWELVGTYHIDTVRNSGENFIVLSMVSKMVYLDKNTSNGNYSDTLEYDGNQGQSRPISIGHFYNAPLKFVDDLDNIFEANNESDALTIDAAYDNYDPFVLTTDYTVEAIVDTGGYGINLVNPPVGVITADINGGDYNGLLTEYAGLDVSDIDEDSLDDIDTDWGGDYGAYISEPSNIRNLVEQFIIAHCGYIYINQSGQLAFGYLKLPAVTADYTASQYYISSDGVDIEPDTAPGLSDGVASMKNWHVFTEGDVEGTVPIVDRDKVTKDFQSYYRSAVTTSGSDTFDDFYAHARNGDYIETLCADSDKAEDLITHLETLYDEPRKFYSFEIIVSDLLTAMTMNIGKTIELTWPRWGLDSGKNLLIAKIDYSNLLQRKIKIVGWG